MPANRLSGNGLSARVLTVTNGLARRRPPSPREAVAGVERATGAGTIRFAAALAPAAGG